MKLSAPLTCCTSTEIKPDEDTEEVRSLDPLAQHLANGDPGAPKELIERHHAELFRYACSLSRDRSAAEDAVQATFERAFTALGKYSRERIEQLSLRPWLYRITLNVVRNVWRDGRHEVPAAEALETAGERPGALSGSASGAEKEAWMDALGALERLPEKQRTAVALRYMEDLPYAEISEVTGWPENTCKTLVRRGIDRLGILMSEGPKESGGIR